MLVLLNHGQPGVEARFQQRRHTPRRHPHSAYGGVPGRLRPHRSLDTDFHPGTPATLIGKEGALHARIQRHGRP